MSSIADNNFQSIISHAKEYGFVFPSSEIYDGLSAVYDYGPNGSELKKNIRDYWWKSMTQMHDNIVGIDAAIFMHPTTWKASGHVDNFSDPMIDNKDSQKRYRVDHLIEGYFNTLFNVAQDEVRKSGVANDITTEIYAISQGKSNYKTIEDFESDIIPVSDSYRLWKEGQIIFDKAISNDDWVTLRQYITDQKIVCSVSKTANWTDIRQFNLMFSTEFGAISSDNPEDNKVYLRPETAQGIFVNFLNVQKTARMKIPFGIAQTGKAFRNEIVARQFIFRMREFEQMEMQFFVRPGTESKWYQYWKDFRLNWHLSLGLPAEKYRYHDHVKLAHYAKEACDIEYEFPFGFKEVEGIHSRGNFDLSQHELFSKKKQQYFDNDIDEATGKPYGNYIPYVVETSIGLDRMFLLLMCNAYEEEAITKEDGTTDTRVVLHLPASIAPNKLAILPLMKKDGLPEIAKALLDECRSSFKCFYEEKDAIGKRYRRQDAIGTPFCVTIDHQTKEDNMVTIRYRDSMQQERIALSDVKALVLNAIS